MAELSPEGTAPSPCCSPSAQETCCEPGDKDACCGRAAGAGCGCSAGEKPGTTVAESDIRESVRARYAAAALSAREGLLTDQEGRQVFGGALYEDEAEGAPPDAVEASLGCGIPTAVADLHQGETVLDLGSGAGADVLISARRVGATGKAIGLDMTDEMLDLARANTREAGIDNVEFLKGDIEEIPLADGSVDVVISNCVINLAADKRKVLEEAFRVLKPGGKFAVSDIVVRGNVPDSIRANMELRLGCVAGALEEQEIKSLLRQAGFAKPSI